MDGPIVVINEAIEIINYNFLDVNAIEALLNTKVPVTRIIITQIKGYGLPKPPYFDAQTGGIDRGKCDLFHKSMINILNSLGNLNEIIIDNYDFLEDYHFNSIQIGTLRKLTTFRLIQCRRLSPSLFGWISNNCHRLKNFELSCRYILSNPNYETDVSHETEVFYDLDETDLLNFFERNSNSLETCILQSQRLGKDVFSETIIGAIRRCTSLQHLHIMLLKYCVDLADVLIILLIPSLTTFKFSVGILYHTHVNFINGVDHRDGVIEQFDGVLDIVGDSAGCVIETNFNQNLISVLNTSQKHIAYLTMTLLNGLSREVVKNLSFKTTLGGGLVSIKFLNCGDMFFHDDIVKVVHNSVRVKFIAVVEGSSSLGETSIQCLDGVILVVKKNQVKWNTASVRYHKKFLMESDFSWLSEETESGIFTDSEDESADESKV